MKKLVIIIYLISINLTAQFTYDLIPFKTDKDGLWGFKDYNDIVVVEPIYENVTHFYNGFSMVYETHKGFNYIDSKGEKLLKNNVSFISPFNAKYSIIKDEEYVRLIDRKGKTIDLVSYNENLSNNSQFFTQGNFYNLGGEIKHLEKGPIDKKFKGKKIIFLNCSIDSNIEVIPVVYTYEGYKRLIITDPFKNEDILRKNPLEYLSNYDYYKFLFLGVSSKKDPSLSKYQTFDYKGNYICCDVNNGGEYLDKNIKKIKIINYPISLLYGLVGRSDDVMSFDIKKLKESKLKRNEKIVFTKLPKVIKIFKDENYIRFIVNKDINKNGISDFEVDDINVSEYKIDNFSVGKGLQSIFNYTSYENSPHPSNALYGNNSGYYKDNIVNTIVLESKNYFYLYEFTPNYLYSVRHERSRYNTIFIDGVYPLSINDNNPFLVLDKELYEE